MERMSDVWLPDRLAAAVRRLVAERGTSYAQVVRDALRRELARPVVDGVNGDLVVGLLEELVDRLDRVTGRTCPVCMQPRPVDVQFDDRVAHAQCDQKVASLETAAESAQEPVS